MKRIMLLALLPFAPTASAAEDALMREAQQTMERVVRDIGAPDHYQIIADSSGKTHNALAAMIKGERIIQYNPRWVRALNQDARTHWAFRYVVAHEIGHHLGHHLFRNHADREDEIEADLFAGAALYRMGASFEETIAAHASRPNIAISKTHPSSRKRIIYVGLGWQLEACRSDPATCKPEEQSF